MMMRPSSMPRPNTPSRRSLRTLLAIQAPLTIRALLATPPLLAILATLALLPLPSRAQQTPPPDKPLATVNGSVITQSTFEQVLKQALAQGNPDSPQLREAIKNQLIARELFLQEA